MNSQNNFDLANDVINKVKEIYGDEFTPLHRPVFEGNERKYLIDCIDSNFVSSVGKRVNEFEKKVAEFTGSQYAIATVNGTAALHVAIELAGVRPGEEVISQALTFIATCNAITYAGANPLFLDVDLETMGLSPLALKDFLNKNAEKKTNGTFNKISGKKISACIPMHTFGFPCRIAEIAEICADWDITLIEDAAESLGSYVDGRHTGTFASMATLSFNGNKVITTGGGGMIITDDYELAKRAKHITTTAKVPHPYEFVHDEIGYNYRMPNLNAALGCAQMERLEEFLTIKAQLADQWDTFFNKRDTDFVKAIDGNKANHWLNAIILDSREARDEFLKMTNDNNVMTRPIWTLMSKLPMFKNCQTDGLENSLWLEDRMVNIPSSVPDGAIKKLDI
ncbi:LegC family aminotransferase [Gammaproteobacteria bacterium]|nr:LegC family aminotransferase [Gammaproteobacteria bacterium]